jgi:hypothetical protein
MKYLIIALCFALGGCATAGDVGVALGTGFASYQQARIDAAVDARVQQQQVVYVQPTYAPYYRRGWGRRW